MYSLRTIAVISFVFIACIVYGQATRIDAHIIVEDVQRDFIVVVPSGPVPEGGYPVVFGLHASAHDGADFAETTEWPQKGEQEKILTVYPSSLKYCVFDEDGEQRRIARWNSGTLHQVKCPEPQDFKDDVLFIRVLLDSITARFPVDRSRVYATGFSNGATMAAKLAIEASDIFTAVHSAGSSLRTSDSGAAKRMIPTFVSFGTDDPNFIPNGLDVVPFNDSVLMVVGHIIRDYINIFGLSEDYTRDSSEFVLHYLFNTLAATADWEFNLGVIKGLKHQYGTDLPRPMKDVVWDFFNRFSIPLAVSKADKDEGTLQLWPNPAEHFVTIELGGVEHFTLRSILGEVVFSVRAYDKKRIELTNVAAGMYVVEVNTKTGVKRQLLRVK